VGLERESLGNGINFKLFKMLKTETYKVNCWISSPKVCLKLNQIFSLSSAYSRYRVQEAPLSRPFKHKSAGKSRLVQLKAIAPLAAGDKISHINT